MITQSHIPPLWLDACPSFGPAFAASCAAYGEELLYVHAGAFADHLLGLHRARQHAEFASVASFIERLLTEGDRYTREFATIGILESVQNVWGHSEVSPAEFLRFLQPAGMVSWQHLDQFWAGERPFVPDSLPGSRTA